MSGLEVNSNVEKDKGGTTGVSQDPLNPEVQSRATEPV